MIRAPPSRVYTRALIIRNSYMGVPTVVFGPAPERKPFLEIRTGPYGVLAASIPWHWGCHGR